MCVCLDGNKTRCFMAIVSVEVDNPPEVLWGMGGGVILIGLPGGYTCITGDHSSKELT